MDGTVTVHGVGALVLVCVGAACAPPWQAEAGAVPASCVVLRVAWRSATDRTLWLQCGATRRAVRVGVRR